MLDRSSVGGSPQLTERNPFHEPALNSLEQIRNLYKSVPNVLYDTWVVKFHFGEIQLQGKQSYTNRWRWWLFFNSVDNLIARLVVLIDSDIFSSPTDSGYRSTPRLDRVPDKVDEINGLPLKFAFYGVFKALQILWGLHQGLPHQEMVSEVEKSLPESKK